MIYLILILVYLIGFASTCHSAIFYDSRLEPRSVLPKLVGYLGYGAAWPITMWVQMYLYWQCANEKEYTKVRKEKQ